MLLYVKNIPSLSFTFSGNLAHTRPRQVMMEYPTFVSSLAAMAESEDPVAQAIALETVGYIGVSLEGKVYMHFHEMGQKVLLKFSM